MAAKKKPTKSGAGDERSFEESLERLEEIVSELEGGELPLEKAIDLFQEGVGLGQRCSTKLEEAEKKVSVLLEKADGSLEESDHDATSVAEPPPARKARPTGRPAEKTDDIPF